MYRSNSSLMAWFLAMMIFSHSSSGVRASFIRKQLGLSHKGAYRMCQMIRVHMAAMERSEMIGGEGKTVHIDEVQLRYLLRPDGGRLASAILLGFACEGRILSAIIPDRKATTLIPHIVARVRPGSTIVTDMHRSYQRVHLYGFKHIRINHSVAFHDFKGNTSGPIECYWSTVRRILRSTRQCSRDNLWSFIAEIEFLYNRRHLKQTIFEELISNFPEVDISNLSLLRARFEWAQAMPMPAVLPAIGQGELPTETAQAADQTRT